MSMIKYTALRKPSKGDKLDPAWGRSVVDAINSITPISGKNVRMDRTIHGNVINVTAVGGTGSSTTIGSINAVPCEVVGGNALNGYTVNVYEKGFLVAPTSTGTLFVMQFNTNTEIPVGTKLLAFKTESMIIGGTEQPGN